MKATVYLVRHAEAEGNVYRRCHGWYDSLLTPRAYQQLPYLAERFASVPIAAVYSSDLFRARVTGKSIADKKGLTVRTRPNLREVNMGDWEDLTWAELPMLEPDVYHIWATKPWEALPPNGENIIDAGKRMLDEVRILVQKHMDEEIVVATHGAAIRGALTIAKNLQPKDMALIGWCDNTSVSKLEFDETGKIHVVYQNDISHLPDELSTFTSLQWKNDRATPESPEVYFRNINLNHAEDAERAVYYMREMHQHAYGTDKLLNADLLLSDMEKSQKLSPRSITFGVLPENGKTAALVYLNASNQLDEKTGMVGGLCIDSNYRGKGLSQQILGQAISVYREMGKEYLGAYVAENNERAKGFYKKYAFNNSGEHQTENGKHYLMQKRIAID